MIDHLKNYLIYIISYLYWLFMVDLLPLQIKLGWDKGIYLKIQKHSTYLLSKLKYYNNLSESLSRKDFINKVLQDTDRIRGIIFIDPDIKKYIVQLSRHGKSLYLEYPADNIHDDSFDRQLQVEKLLIENEFFFDPSSKEISQHQYWFERITGGKTLKVYFGQNYEEASEIVDKIFSQIYQYRGKVELGLF